MILQDTKESVLHTELAKNIVLGKIELKFDLEGFCIPSSGVRSEAFKREQ